jgi:hypothetical protein
MEIAFALPKIKPQDYLKSVSGDITVRSLIIANLLTIGLSVIEKWNTPTVLFAYWIQSVIIGIFTVVKMLDLKNYTTAGMRVNGVSVPRGQVSKAGIILFFILHYGIFHLVYLVFLSGNLTAVSVPQLIQGGLIFFLNHFYSYLVNRPVDREKTVNLGSVMMAPYGRIIPMHLIIIAGSLIPGVLILPLFLLVKTLVDVIGHVQEHTPVKV